MTATPWSSGFREPRSFDFWPEDMNVESLSPFSGHRDFAPRYQHWRAMAAWPPMPASQQLPLMAWLTSSRGGINSLFVPHFKYRQFIGADPGGSLTLDTAATAGDFSISTNRTGLAAGDFITNSVAGAPRLYMITSAAGSDYGIWPAIRTDLAIGHVFRHLGTHTYLEVGCTMVPVGGLPNVPARPSTTDDKLVEAFTVEFVEPLREGEL